MKIILTLLLGFTSLSAKWHPWSDFPVYNSLYIYERQVPSMFPHKNKIWIVCPFQGDLTYMFFYDVGWYDFSYKMISELQKRGETILFLSSDRIPDWAE